MTTFHAVMIDETRCEFGVSVTAPTRAAAFAKLREDYPESRCDQLESPADTRRGQGWQALKINVPAWQVAEGDGGLIIDQEPIEALPAPCPETLTMALPAPAKALAATVVPAKARKPALKAWKPPKTIFIMTRRGVCPLKLPATLS